MSAEFNTSNNNSQSFVSSSSVPQREDADDLMWELLSLYVDGEASPDEAAQVEQMLRHDAEYARAYSFLNQTGHAVRAIVEVEPPAFLRDAILAKTSHRLTFAKRLSAAMTTLRAQLALPPMGRLALAGGSLAACALLVGVWTARSAGNGNSAPVVAEAALPSNTSVAAAPAPSFSSSSVAKNVEAHPETETPREFVVVPSFPNTRSAIAKVTPAPAKTSPVKLNVDLTLLRPEPSLAVWNATAENKAKTSVASSPKTGASTSGTWSSGKQIARSMPTHKWSQSPGNPVGTGDSNVITQNVSPMMDDNVQHRQPPMMLASLKTDDDLDKKDVVTSNGDGSGTTTSAGSTDTDTPPKGTIVGKLQLSKLPPAARHLQTAADIQRIQEARNMSFTATAMEGMQRRDADLSVISGKF